MVSFYLLRYSSGRLGDVPPEHAHEVAEARWLPLEEAPKLLAYGGEREMAAKRGDTEALIILNALYALNFYSPLVAEQLRSLRKTATIRLGDRSGKYRKGMIVQVLAAPASAPARRSSTPSSTRSRSRASASYRRARSSTTTPRSAAPKRWQTS